MGILHIADLDRTKLLPALAGVIITLAPLTPIAEPVDTIPSVLAVDASAFAGARAVNLLQFLATDNIVGPASVAQPEQREKSKAMSRRSGQSGNLVKQGRWWRVRFRLDEPGIDRRKQMSVKVAPASLKLSRSELWRRAREIVEKSGANSEERFNRVVLGEVIFREQAKVYLQKAISRNRKPLRDTVSIEGAMEKWIFPAIGDLPLRLVDNLSVAPLVEKMCASGLKPRTVNKYVEYIKQVVKSLKAPNGEPIHKRTWDAETMDLPIVEYSEQKRPSLKAKAISELIASSSGQEQALYILLAATGMRISEALALEARHFINGGRTIKVEQQVKKDCPQIGKYLKTRAAKREIDLHPDIGDFFQNYMAGSNGLLFQTARGTPYLYNNLEDRWLTPRLAKMGPSFASDLHDSSSGSRTSTTFRSSLANLISTVILVLYIFFSP